MLCATMSITAQEARDNIDFLLNDTKKPFERYYTNDWSFRLEAGYAQDWQNSKNNTFRDMYTHGANIGLTVDYNLPYNLSLQSGVLYSITAGRSEQHWGTIAERPQIEIINHDILKHQLIIPIRLTYTQPLWKRLALYFYTGPEMQIGLAQQDNINTESISATTLAWVQEKGVPTTPYDRYTENELRRFNIRYGLGGGLQWDCYRLQSGYSFGLNDLTKSPDSQMWEWGWFVSFAYQFK